MCFKWSFRTKSKYFHTHWHHTVCARTQHCIDKPNINILTAETKSDMYFFCFFGIKTVAIGSVGISAANTNGKKKSTSAEQSHLNICIIIAHNTDRMFWLPKTVKSKITCLFQLDANFFLSLLSINKMERKFGAITI